MKNRCRRFAWLPASLFAAVVLPVTLHAQTNVSWSGPTSGDWTTAGDWTPNVVPNNGNPDAGDTYDAVINATGSAYTVTLDSDITVSGFTLDSSDALLLQTNNSTFTAGTASIMAGLYEIDSGTVADSSVTLQQGGYMRVGHLDTGSGGVAGNATLDGTSVTAGTGAFVTVEDGSSLTLQNGATLTGALSLRGDNSNVNFNGPSGTGNPASEAMTIDSQTIDLDNQNNSINFNTGGVTTLGSHEVIFAIAGANATVNAGGYDVTSGPTLINNGQLDATGAGAVLTINAPVADTYGLLNNGGIQALNGGAVYINTFQNAGTLNADGTGSSLNLDGAWSSTGNITLSDGAILNLGGSFATSSLSNITRDDSKAATSINLTGTLDNTGATLAIASGALGSINLAGGTITGGTVNQTGGAVLTPVGSGTLDGVTLNGGLTINDSSRVTLLDGSTINGAILLNGGGGGLIFDGTNTTFTFNGSGETVTIAAGSGGFFTGGFLSITNGNTLIFGPNVTFAGGASGGGANADVADDGTFINKGTINANLPFEGFSSNTQTSLGILPQFFTNAAGAVAEATNGGQLVIGAASGLGTNGASGTTWSNAGTIKGTGGSNVTFDGTWTNTGTIVLAGSTANLGGNFTTASIGAGRLSQDSSSSVNILGALDNTGATLTLSASTGVYNLTGGATVTGGTIQTGGSYLTYSTTPIAPGGNGTVTLNDVQVTGGLTQVNGSYNLTLTNGSTLSGDINLTGAAGGVIFDENATYNGGNITVTNGNFAGVDVTAGHTLTIGSSVTTSGGGGAEFTASLGGAGTIINDGSIIATTSSSNGPGQIFTVSSGTFVNNGHLGTDGRSTLFISSPVTQGAGGVIDLGTVAVPGSITVSSLTVNGGSIIGNGTLTADGGITINSGLIAPGHSPGSLGISGPLTLESSAQLAFELGGTDAGSTYDQLHQTGGVLTLGGRLSVTFLNGFESDSNIATDTFTIITSDGTLVGAFSNVASGSRLTTADGDGSFVVTYAGQDDVVLSGFLVPEPGSLALCGAAGIGMLAAIARARRGGRRRMIEVRRDLTRMAIAVGCDPGWLARRQVNASNLP